MADGTDMVKLLDLDMYCTFFEYHCMDIIKMFASNGYHVTTWIRTPIVRSAPCPCVSFEGCRLDISDGLIVVASPPV